MDRCDKAQWRLHWRPVNVFCKINSFLKRKCTVCRTFEMTHVFHCCRLWISAWTLTGHTVAKLVEALRYKLEGCGFDSQWCHWNFSLTSSSGCTMAPGLTQPLTEMSTRNISCGAKVASANGWQPYHPQVLTVLKSGSLNLLEPSGPVQACNGIAWTLIHKKCAKTSKFQPPLSPWYIWLQSTARNDNRESKLL